MQVNTSSFKISILFKWTENEDYLFTSDKNQDTAFLMFKSHAFIFASADEKLTYNFTYKLLYFHKSHYVFQNLIFDLFAIISS